MPGLGVFPGYDEDIRPQEILYCKIDNFFFSINYFIKLNCFTNLKKKIKPVSCQIFLINCFFLSFQVYRHLTGIKFPKLSINKIENINCVSMCPPKELGIGTSIEVTVSGLSKDRKKQCFFS